MFAAALDRLDAALPGEGDLVTRYADWRTSQIVPPEAMLDVFSALRERFRAATAELLGLPPDEDVETELVRDEPWLAYNYYLGGRRSRIAINVDLPIAAPELVDLVAHEAYPGHHTEHAWKEHLLVDAGVVEESLVLVPTPQSMVSEGIAETAWELLEDATRDEVTAVLTDAGVRLRPGADGRGRGGQDAAALRRPQRGAAAARGRRLGGGGRRLRRAVVGADARSTRSRASGSSSTRSGARTRRRTPSAATSPGGTSRGAPSATARC